MKKILYLLVVALMSLATNAQERITLEVYNEIDARYNNSDVDNGASYHFRCREIILRNGEVFGEGITGATKFANGETLGPDQGGWNLQFTPFYTTYNRSKISFKRKQMLKGIDVTVRFQWLDPLDNHWKEAYSVDINSPYIGKNEFHIHYAEGWGPSAEQPTIWNTRKNYYTIEDGFYSSEEDNGIILPDKSVYLSVIAQKMEWTKRVELLPKTGVFSVEGKIFIDPKTLSPKVDFAAAIRNTLLANVQMYNKAIWVNKTNTESYILLSDLVSMGNFDIVEINAPQNWVKYRITNLPLIAGGIRYWKNTPFHFPDQSFLATDRQAKEAEIWGNWLGKNTYYGDLLRYDLGGGKTAIKYIPMWMHYALKDNAADYWNIETGSVAPIGALNGGSRIISSKKTVGFNVIGIDNIITRPENTQLISANEIVYRGPDFELVGIVAATTTTNSFIISGLKSRTTDRFQPIVNPAGGLKNLTTPINNKSVIKNGIKKG